MSGRGGSRRRARVVVVPRLRWCSRCGELYCGDFGLCDEHEWLFGWASSRWETGETAGGHFIAEARGGFGNVTRARCSLCLQIALRVRTVSLAADGDNSLVIWFTIKSYPPHLPRSELRHWKRPRPRRPPSRDLYLPSLLAGDTPRPSQRRSPSIASNCCECSVLIADFWHRRKPLKVSGYFTVHPAAKIAAWVPCVTPNASRLPGLWADCSESHAAWSRSLTPAKVRAVHGIEKVYF